MDRESIMMTMRGAISNVLGTMFFQLIQINESNHSLQDWFSDTKMIVGATIHFHGPSTGSFYLLLPDTMVAGITANFLGIEENAINEEQKKDVVKEALNMIAGNTLSLVDKTGDLRLGIPDLIEENNVTNDNLGDLKGDFVLIETEENRLAAGIMFEV